MYQINKLEEKIYMMFLINAKKKFDRVQYFSSFKKNFIVNQEFNDIFKLIKYIYLKIIISIVFSK